MKRRKSRQINIGGVPIGGDAPISVQSMTNTDTRNFEATMRQIWDLHGAGCELVRLAVPDEEAADQLPALIKASPVPLIADIHFDYRLALKALEGGIHGLRINPGNIGSEARVKQVVEMAKGYGVPIRIGVNGGSLEKELLEKYGHVTADALVESALGHINILEKHNFDMIKISLKSSDVPMMLEAYQKLAEKVDYPLHIGVTESGTLKGGTIKSSVGIGALLAMGIGDTLRVSLTDNPVHEVEVGFEILKVLGLREQGATLVSCPTCGRTEIDLIPLAQKVEELIKEIKSPIKVAVMGCVVNGPGEAREADIGIAGGKGVGLIFRKGQVIKKVPEDQLLPALREELEHFRYQEEK